MRTAPVRTAVILLALAVPPSASAWNGTGHQIVARIAWDTMTPTVRERVVALLQAAPSNACLAELMPTDSRPIAARRREFFLRASTWADTLRPGDDGGRACTRFHRSEWHYVNFFWQGVSGATGADRPADRSDMRPAPANVVAQLPLLRALATCAAPRCGTTTAERAIALAWILHLVGDIHQPLHTSARVTGRLDERQGDQGGNLFILDPGPPILRLHGYWDGIEREFRGFGHVEQLDTEVFEEFNDPGLHRTSFEPVAVRTFSPPLLTKTWFHLGPVGYEFTTRSEADFSPE